MNKKLISCAMVVLLIISLIGSWSNASGLYEIRWDENGKGMYIVSTSQDPANVIASNIEMGTNSSGENVYHVKILYYNIYSGKILGEESFDVPYTINDKGQIFPPSATPTTSNTAEPSPTPTITQPPTISPTPTATVSPTPTQTPTKKLTWPVPNSTSIISEFGTRVHPKTGKKSKHKGIDIGAKSGTLVIAADQGTVSTSGWISNYGKAIIITHSKGRQTLYGHLSETNVSAGQKVKRGQKIGEVGSTGLSTGPHLHFEVRINNEKKNPINYLE